MVSISGKGKLLPQVMRRSDLYHAMIGHGGSRGRGSFRILTALTALDQPAHPVAAYHVPVQYFLSRERYWTASAIWEL